MKTSKSGEIKTEIDQNEKPEEQQEDQGGKETVAEEELAASKLVVVASFFDSAFSINPEIEINLGGKLRYMDRYLGFLGVLGFEGFST